MTRAYSISAADIAEEQARSPDEVDVSRVIKLDNSDEMEEEEGAEDVDAPEKP